MEKMNDHKNNNKQKARKLGIQAWIEKKPHEYNEDNILAIYFNNVALHIG